MRKLILIFALSAFCAVSSAQTTGQKDSLVNLPGGMTRSYEQTTGKLLMIGSDDLRHMPTGDLRNRLTGMLPGVEVNELGGGFYKAATDGFTDYSLGGISNNFNINGFQQIKVFVDGIPMPFNQLLLEPNQVESITVLSDVLDKSKAGPMASSGALYIKTRRGSYNAPLKITADVETGVSFPDRIPGWVNGSDYAVLNNISRTSAGLDPLYSDEAVAAFKEYRENDLLYPAVNYKDKMLEPAVSTTSFGINVSAGSQNIKYHLSLSGTNAGDIIKASQCDYNKLNFAGNVSTRIGQYIEASAGFMGLLSFRRTPNVGWNSYRLVPEIAYPLVIGKVGEGEDVSSEISNMLGQNIYGVSKTFTGNYYAKLMEGGRNMTRNRSGFFHVDLDVDMSWMLKGLKSKTSMMTSSFLSTTIGKSNDYIAYYWDPVEGVQEISSHKGVKETKRSMSSNTTSSTLSLYERLYYDWYGKGHGINAGVTYYQSSSAQTGDSKYQRLQYLQGDLAWSYKGRYNLEATGQYAGSSRLKKGNRWEFFPTVGTSWIVSNESFLKDNPVLTNLKIYGQAGVLGSANLFGSPFLYQSIYTLKEGMDYGPSSTTGSLWFGNKTHQSQYTTLSRLANDELTWETIIQQNAGIDIGLLDCVTLSVDWFRWKREGIISDVMENTPVVYGLTANVYENYEARLTQGVNIAVGLNRSWGDFTLGAWASASISDQKYDRLVTDNWLYEYQKQTGTSIYSIRGFECIGKYESQEEIESLPSYVDKASLRVGDLKYKDQNNDKVIDANDKVVIGYGDPKVRYTTNLSLAWKNWDLLIVGTGRTGEDINLTNSTYFTGPTGMDNYSQFVKDQLGNEFPRLDYYGVPNNEVNSTFWLRKCSWFKIQAVNLGYTLPLRKGNRMGLESIRFDVKGSNLLTLTDMDYIDPEDTAAGLSSYPLSKVLSFGVKLNF